jgi:zinc and cadmium transporter
MTLLYILLASFSVSLISLVGVLTLIGHTQKSHEDLMHLVALAAGTLVGGAFLHLLPEAVADLGNEIPFYLVLVSFALFFFIEKVLHWRHCHDEDCEIHSFGYLNLAGDVIHNFIDGVIIAASFLVSFKLGVITTLAIMLHEIPQELGDFGVLLLAGFKRSKALSANFLTALTAMIGALVGYFLSVHVQGIVPYLLPLAAGGFLYIAASDLIPQMMKENRLEKWSVSFLFFILGIVLMFGMKFLEVGA